MKKTKHLDIGCGYSPRNIYNCDELYALDVYQSPKLPKKVFFKKANVISDPIPFKDNFFDCVSAFDFIEHIPRISLNSNGVMKFPFIRLMNEIWRVLNPGGIFYAVTPAFPRNEAFQDPTHVNFITANTHKYFCGDTSYVQSYGFFGKFEVIEVKWVHLKFASKIDNSFSRKIKAIYWTIFKQRIKAHLLWKLRAIK